MSKEAIILSGGGANGAYEVGVLKALVSGAVRLAKSHDQTAPLGPGTIDPQVFAGTSIGAINASFLASQWDEYGPGSVGNLERKWLEVLAAQPGKRGNGSIRFRGNLLEYLTPSAWYPDPFPAARELVNDGAYFGWEGIQRLVHLIADRDEPLTQRLAQLFDFSMFVSTEPLLKTITETLDFEKLRSSKRDLVISATNWTTGETEHFTNQHMTRTGGPKRVLASASIPGVFPPTMIGSQPFVDGNVLENTPLRPAIKLGATTFHVFYLDPDIKSIPFSHIRNTVGTLYRMQTIGWAGRIKDNIGDVQATNEKLDSYYSRKPRNGPEAAGLGEIMGFSREIKEYSPLTIHRFAPTDAIEGGALGMLNVSRDRLQELIERGFTDASAHDCKAARCVLPSQAALDATEEREDKLMSVRAKEDDVLRTARRLRAIQPATERVQGQGTVKKTDQAAGGSQTGKR